MTLKQTIHQLRLYMRWREGAMQDLALTQGEINSMLRSCLRHLLEQDNAKE